MTVALAHYDNDELVYSPTGECRVRDAPFCGEAALLERRSALGVTSGEPALRADHLTAGFDRRAEGLARAVAGPRSNLPETLVTTCLG